MGACTVGQKKKETPLLILIQIILKKWNMPINVDYCLLQFDAFKFFLVVRLHEGLYLTLIFSVYTPKFFNEIVKFTYFNLMPQL